MNIHATFAWLVDAEGPSMIHAWDEYDVEENHDGFVHDRLAAIGRNEIIRMEGRPLIRTVLIKIDYDWIETLFHDPQLTAEGMVEVDEPTDLSTDSDASESRGMNRD